MRISLDDLDDRDRLAEKQHEHLANPSQPLTTTRSRQRKTDSSINPLQPNIMTFGQVLMGSTTQTSPEDIAKAYLNVATQSVSGLFGDAGREPGADGSSPSGGDGSTSGGVNAGAEGSVNVSNGENAQTRGWGAPPVPRSSMVDIRAGANNVAFPGGVHVQIAPLVVALVNRIESATGELAKDGWCWGYAPRHIDSDPNKPWSNHAWGLAIDFNAPNHPLGAENTWGGKGPELSQIANSLGFRFGGDYTGRKDDMHFEFMGTPEDAQRLTSPEVVDLSRLERL